MCYYEPEISTIIEIYSNFVSFFGNKRRGYTNNTICYYCFYKLGSCLYVEVLMQIQKMLVALEAIGLQYSIQKIFIRVY